MQEIVDRDGRFRVAEDQSVRQLKFRARAAQRLGGQGGELINLPPDEQAAMMKTLASVGEDVSNEKPALHEAYETVVTAAAKRTRQAPSQ